MLKTLPSKLRLSSRLSPNKEVGDSPTFGLAVQEHLANWKRQVRINSAFKVDKRPCE